MKTSKYHIFCSRILLFCFIAGQCMVYAHQHPVSNRDKVCSSSKSAPGQTLKEKCSLCDAMLHNTMVTSCQVYFNPVSVTDHVFKNFKYDFAVIRLIHFSGRAPPCPV